MLAAGLHDLANSLLKIPAGYGQVNVEAKVETARRCLSACLPFIKMVSRMPRFKLTCHYVPTKCHDLSSRKHHSELCGTGKHITP